MASSGNSLLSMVQMLAMSLGVAAAERGAGGFHGVFRQGDGRCAHAARFPGHLRRHGADHRRFGGDLLAASAEERLGRRPLPTRGLGPGLNTGSGRVDRAEHASTGAPVTLREVAALGAGAPRQPGKGRRFDLLRRQAASAATTPPPRPAAAPAGAPCRCALSAPPPQTISVSLLAAWRATSAAQARAVNSVKVACTSAARAWATGASRAASHGGLNRSRPVLLGGALAQEGFGQQRVPAARAATCPLAAQAPPASKGWPVCCWHQWSISALPGPQSKPSTLPPLRRRQHAQVGRCRRGSARRRRWPGRPNNAGGRPAPAARPGRRRRRRGCGSRPPRRCRMSSASSAGLLICSV